MDCLPVELVLIILTWGGPLYIKINRLVCRAWRDLLPRPKSSRPPLEEAAREGWSDVFDFIARRLASLRATKKTLKYCVRNGWPIHTDSWQRLLSYQGIAFLRKAVNKKKYTGTPLEANIDNSVLSKVIRSGNLAYVEEWFDRVLTRPGINTSHLCSLAFNRGHLDIVKWFFARGYKPEEGHFTKHNVNEECITWWLSNMGDLQANLWKIIKHGTPEICRMVCRGKWYNRYYCVFEVAVKGYWDLVDEAYAAGFVPEYSTVMGIVLNGNIDRLLQALPMCNLHEFHFAEIAAKTTNPEIIKQIMAHYRKIYPQNSPEDFVNEFLYKGNITGLESNIELVKTHINDIDIWHGWTNPESVRFLVSLAITPPPNLFNQLLKFSFQDYFHDESAKWKTKDLVWLLRLLSREELVKLLTSATLSKVLNTGKVRLFLKMLRWAETILPEKLQFDNLDALQLVLEFGKLKYVPKIVTLIKEGTLPCITSNTRTIELAIDHNYKQLISWLASRKYSIANTAYLRAAMYNNLVVLDLLYKLGIAIPSVIYYVAYSNINYRVMDWARSKGCQWGYFRFTYNDRNLVGFVAPDGKIMYSEDAYEMLERLIGFLGNNIVKPNQIEFDRFYALTGSLEIDNLNDIKIVD
jgi:hypothetical protein